LLRGKNILHFNSCFTEVFLLSNVISISRYEKARIFVVLQQRPEVSGGKIELDVPLNVAELKRIGSEWVYESISSISEVASIKPDVLFLRNGISMKRNWLFYIVFITYKNHSPNSV